MNKPFPLHQTVLLDGAILLSEAFGTKGERDAVPQWRDGNMGKELQKSMVHALSSRLLEYGCLDQVCQSGKSAFLTGGHWVSFTRVVGPPNYHLKTAMERVFGAQAAWTDAIKVMYRSVWTGEYDADILKLSTLFPSSLDTQPVQFQNKILELFHPILTLVQQKETEASRLQSAAEKEAEKKREEEPSVQSVQSEPSNSAVDGDVTDELFKEQDSAGKKNLCDALNKDAKRKQEAALEEQVNKAAAEILRTRLVVVDSVPAAKSYMETCHKEGLRTRVAFTDWTQFQSLQSSGWMGDANPMQSLKSVQSVQSVQS